MLGVRSFLRLLVAAFITSALLPSGALGAGGTVTGSLSSPVPKGADASVQALSGATGQVVAATTPSRRGTFSLTLPSDGAYVLRTTVVSAGKTLATAAVPISVKKGQRRKGLRLTPKRKKVATRKQVARRAYVQEQGQVTAGVSAFSVENFTGGTGDWSPLNRGITAMLITDLTGDGATPCETVVVANAEDRKLIEQELDLQKSKYFDPKTRVKRNFIIGDLAITGTVTTSADGQSATVNVSIKDARTGAVVDTVTAKMDRDRFFEQEQALAKALAERVCRRPAAYKLTLAVDGTGTFATHSATGRIDSTLTALRSGGAAGAPPTAWSGVAPLAWANLAFASSLPGCTYSDPVGPAVSWSAQLSVSNEANVKVDWSPVGNDMSMATVNCPDTNGRMVSIAGQPGPALLGIQPTSAELPLAGGKIPLTGGFTSGRDGWNNAGALVVEPIWTNDAP